MTYLFAILELNSFNQVKFTSLVNLVEELDHLLLLSTTWKCKHLKYIYIPSNEFKFMTIAFNHTCSKMNQCVK